MMSHIRPPTLSVQLMRARDDKDYDDAYDGDDDDDDDRELGSMLTCCFAAAHDDDPLIY
jgi:hypothetical protein